MKLGQIAQQHSSWGGLYGRSAEATRAERVHAIWVDRSRALGGKAGLSSKAFRVMFANPLVAITILRLDLSAGLFVPVECLMLAEPDGGASFTYLEPSSLIALNGSPELPGLPERLIRRLKIYLVASVAAKFRLD